MPRPRQHGTTLQVTHRRPPRVRLPDMIAAGRRPGHIALRELCHLPLQVTHHAGGFPVGCAVEGSPASDDHAR